MSSIKNLIICSFHSIYLYFTHKYKYCSNKYVLDDDEVIFFNSSIDHTLQEEFLLKKASSSEQGDIQTSDYFTSFGEFVIYLERQYYLGV